jgi:hypothetical protein
MQSFLRVEVYVNSRACFAGGFCGLYMESIARNCLCDTAAALDGIFLCFSMHLCFE